MSPSMLLDRLAPDRNPFAQLIDFERVRSAVETSERLAALNRRVILKLDAEPAPKVGPEKAPKPMDLPMREDSMSSSKLLPPPERAKAMWKQAWDTVRGKKR